MNVHARIETPIDYAELEKGLPAMQVLKLIEAGKNARAEVYRIVPERTFKRRLAARAKLRLEEADAIGCLLRINALAKWAFGDDATARAFLDLANPALGNRIPQVMDLTDAGAREVEALLHRFASGNYLVPRELMPNH